METIAVSELRSNLMKVLKEIEHGSTIDITSRGVVVARLIPPKYNKEKALERLEEIGKTAVIDDIISPTDAQWEATQ